MASRTASGVDLARFNLDDGQPQAKGKSAAQKGQYYKQRTMKWLKAQGYAVAYMERLSWIRSGEEPCGVCHQRKMFPVKADQFGADLLAIRADLLIFVQVKLHADHIMAARREFAKFPFPALAKRWVVVWEVGGRNPRIIDCSDDTAASILPMPRQRRGRLGAQGSLF